MVRVVLTENPLSIDDLWDGLLDPSLGAVVLFAGVVRGEEDGDPIAAIRYEAYAAMARTELVKAAREVAARFRARVAVHHRVGPVPVRGVSLLVGCAAAHRAEAFDAAREVVERIKRDIPIWKVDFTPAAVAP